MKPVTIRTLVEDLITHAAGNLDKPVDIYYHFTRKDSNRYDEFSVESHHPNQVSIVIPRYALPK